MSKTAARFALVCALVGFGASVGAAYVHYRLLFDPTYLSFCDVNATISCTQVYLSRYSTVGGIPVEYGATPYAGDAYFEDWPATLDAIAALAPQKLVPGRGAALMTSEQVAAGLTGTRRFIVDLYAAVKAGVAAGKDLRTIYRETYDRLKPQYGQWVIFDHCMPFDVSRAYDLATKYRDPRIWTAQRDKEMWEALED